MTALASIRPDLLGDRDRGLHAARVVGRDVAAGNEVAPPSSNVCVSSFVSPGLSMMPIGSSMVITTARHHLHLVRVLRRLVAEVELVVGWRPCSSPRR